MTEINYKDFQDYLSTLKPADLPAVFLFHGEEYIHKSALAGLMDRICPEAARAFNVEVMDAGTASISAVLESVSTYPFLSGQKIIVFTDAKVFYSGQDKLKLLENAKAAFDQQDMTKAAKALLKCLVFQNLTLEEANPENISAALQTEAGSIGDDTWVLETIEFARQARLTTPAAQDEAALLESAVEKGFPKGNCLIITTDLVDKRKRLYQTIKSHGIIIDCSMPKGNRQADRQAQEALLQETAKHLLSGTGKKIEPSAYHLLMEMTGVDLRVFAGNIEKLISYAGERNSITEADVRTVLSRTKQDPIFELTGAVGDRQLGKAMVYLDSLLSAGFHPLQILSALIKQVRKLVVIKDFSVKNLGNSGLSGMSLQQFKTNILPLLSRFDAELVETLAAWEEDLAAAKLKSSKRSSKKPETDILISANPNNPYPTYLLLRKSEGFAMAELLNALQALQQADTQLKSTGQSPRLILENALFNIIGTQDKQKAI